MVYIVQQREDGEGKASSHFEKGEEGREKKVFAMMGLGLSRIWSMNKRVIDQGDRDAKWARDIEHVGRQGHISL